MMRYYVLCMRISNISIYVRTEMCTNNKFVSTLIWKRCFHTDMKTSRSIVCQTNMHLIMRIENAFKFCGKLIHFYKERISFLFYCEDGKRGAVSWLSLNAGEVKQTSRIGEYRPGQLYILSSWVAPDITDADVHALCTKPAVLKMKESGKSSRNHRTVRGRTETCRHQVNERSVWLPQRSMKVNWQPHVFQLHIKKE
jgi:hypothetical protein